MLWNRLFSSIQPSALLLNNLTSRNLSLITPLVRILGDGISADLSIDGRYDLKQRNSIGPSLINYVQTRGAARKGKRILRQKEARLRAAKRRLMEAQNPKLRKDYKKTMKIDKDQFRFLTQRQLDLTLPESPEDDVYFVDKFRRKNFSFQEAISFHRQAVHPDVLNLPDSLVTATIELNLKMKIKKKKYIETIKSTLVYPHQFEYQVKPRKIVALSSKPEDQEAARQAGAILAGSADIAQMLKKSQLTTRDFDHLVCHTDFLVDFAAVKGMKGAPFFPTKQRGNFGDDIVKLVEFFRKGIDYSLRRNAEEPEFGFIDCYFGRLNMSDQQLQDNLVAFFKSVDRFRPLNLADGKQFFERVTISTPATQELFLIKFWELYGEYQDPEELALEEVQAAKN